MQAPEKNKAHKKPHLGPKDSTYRPSKDDNADDDDDEDENPPIQPRAKVDQTAKTQQDKEPTQDVQERQLGSQPDLPDPSSTVQGVEHDGDRPRRKSVRVKVKSQKDVNMVTVPAKAGKKTTAKKTAKKPGRKPAKTAAIAAGSETEAAYSKKTVVQLKALMKNRKVTVARGDRKADLIAKLVADYKMKQGGMTEETTENPPARKKSVPRGRPLGAKNKKTAKTSGRKRSAPQDDDDDVVAVQQAQKPKRIRKLAIKRAQPMVEEDLTEQAEQAKENIEDQVLEEQNEPTTTRGRRGTKRASEADNDDARVGRSKRQKAKKN